MPRTTDKPLTAVEFKFVTSYVRLRDMEKAAKACRLPTSEGRKLYKRSHVRADIDRRLNVIATEQCRLAAAEVHLTNSLLDEELKKICKIDAETHGMLKLNAIKLGLVVTGRLRDGQLEAMVKPAVSAELSSSMLYQQVFQRTEQVTQQVTQTVTQKEPALPPTLHSPQPALASDIPVIRVY